MQLRASSRGRSLLAGHLVLLAEDAGNERSVTELHLSAAGARVLIASTAYQALLVASQHPLTAAVLDLQIGAHAVTQLNAYLVERSVPCLIVAGSAHISRDPMPGKALQNPHLADTLLELIVSRRRQRA